MSALQSTCGLSARLLRQTIRNDTPVRGLSTAARRLAAHNFTMPALSPTMTEGNITAWRVREGDAYSAGHVLLEIETDKATMDVEAQEDGVLVKIMQGDGAKSVQVGTRIGVTAEPDDDIKTLQLPPDEQAGQHQAKAQDAKADAPRASEPPSSADKSKKQTMRTAGKNTSYEQLYPLLPSVEHLVKQHGIQDATLRTITPTGPGGRLLKGDVLAHLGEIDAKRPTEISSFLEKLSHLDLSNIKLAKREPAKREPANEDQQAKTKAEAKTKPAPVEHVLVPLDQQVSLEPLLKLQTRLKAELGAAVPLDVLIKRAVEAANAGLPALPSKPSPDEIFDQILGIPPRPRASTTRGNYSPVWASSAASSPVARRLPPLDIIDALAAKRPTQQDARPAVITAEPATQSTRSFGLLVAKNEQHRAEAFMGKLEHILTREPDRLLFMY